MFGFFKNKKDKDLESKNLANGYMNDFNCDDHISKYKECQNSWLTYNKKKCTIHIEEY